MADVAPVTPVAVAQAAAVQTPKTVPLTAAIPPVALGANADSSDADGAPLKRSRKGSASASASASVTGSQTMTTSPADKDKGKAPKMEKRIGDVVKRHNLAIGDATKILEAIAGGDASWAWLDKKKGVDPFEEKLAALKALTAPSGTLNSKFASHCFNLEAKDLVKVYAADALEAHAKQSRIGDLDYRKS